jgi:hypothetical protein
MARCLAAMNFLGGRLFFGELHRDLGNTLGDGCVRLLEDDDVHRPSARHPVRQLDEAEEGGL